MKLVAQRLACLSSLLLVAGCPNSEPGSSLTDTVQDVPSGDTSDTADAADSSDAADVTIDVVRPPPPEDDGIYGYASTCVALEAYDGTGPALHAAATADGDGFAFSAEAAGDAARFRMRASDLGTYLFYDTDGAYLTAEAVAGSDPPAWRFGRPTALHDAVELLEDGFKSPAEWVLEESVRDPARYQLKHYATGMYLALDGLVADAGAAAVVTMIPQDGCADFPELTLDAEGTVTQTTWEGDGDLYGIAEIHSHMMTNAGFGGGGIFHGAPFHRLGVEHALPDCDLHHGVDGKRDVVGFFYDNDGDFDIATALPILVSGEAEEFNHATDGYPDFVEWPNPRLRSTHQAMYYRWLERAWLGGLRLVVELATTNSVLCDMVVGIGAQSVRYSCNDMVSVDRAFAEVRAMERYIDAQAGGPGEGWFRVVESPAEAREVVGQGKLAVVLGIETSNLFDCFSTPHDGFEMCTPELVQAKLDAYEAQGVRVIFPVHKYDNAFTPGDGSPGIIELGNVINSGHYSDFVEDCPDIDAHFDGGDVTFGGMNKPREEYFSEPPLDTSGFADDPVDTVVPYVEEITAPSLPGQWCQQHGLTPLGEMLIDELMDRGMIIDLGHLPRRSLETVYQMLEARDYPATKTHGGTNDGRLYAIGGLRGSGVKRCADPNQPGKLVSDLAEDVQARIDNGQYPSEGLSFDLNGFAGSPGPRFGDLSSCSQPQSNPVEYPFTSYDGAITFTSPQLGNRAVDFNTEGMIHIGLLPELIEDMRRDGATDEQLEPLFRSAEAYIRMWEKAESRALP